MYQKGNGILGLNLSVALNTDSLFLITITSVYTGVWGGFGACNDYHYTLFSLS